MFFRKLTNGMFLQFSSALCNCIASGIVCGSALTWLREYKVACTPLRPARSKPVLDLTPRWIAFRAANLHAFDAHKSNV